MCGHSGVNGRSSRDPMLVLMALFGDEQKAGYDVICGKASVDFTTGKNSFTEKKGRPHKYVKRKFSPEYYSEKINETIKSEI